MLPMSVRLTLLARARVYRGLLGIGLRYSLLGSIVERLGSNVSIREDVYLLGVGGLTLGNNVSIHPMSYLDATGGVTIGSDVSIAHSATIMSTTHTFELSNIAIKDQPTIARPTVIGDNCWIGAQAVILGGVRLGSGSVVAANSVVNRDVPANAVVAGSPAKVVKQRV